jgi:hypothetical protein
VPITRGRVVNGFALLLDSLVNASWSQATDVPQGRRGSLVNAFTHKPLTSDRQAWRTGAEAPRKQVTVGERAPERWPVSIPFRGTPLVGAVWRPGSGTGMSTGSGCATSNHDTHPADGR